MHFNAYNRQLTAKEIESNAHRQFVGGLWQEVGLLQYDFLLSKGLEPGNSLLDLGCGALRGGRFRYGLHRRLETSKGTADSQLQETLYLLIKKS